MNKKKSFEDSVKDVTKAIVQMAYRLSQKSAMEYDDAQQEMLITVWKSYTKYKSNKGASFSTWAIGAMINRSKTLLHRYNSKPQEIAVDDEEVLDQLCDGMIDRTDRILNSMVLDAIEKILYERRSNSVSDKRAYEMFRMMRCGKSLLACARKMKINQGWLSRIFASKIKSLRDIM